VDTAEVPPVDAFEPVDTAEVPPVDAFEPVDTAEVPPVDAFEPVVVGSSALPQATHTVAQASHESTEVSVGLVRRDNDWHIWAASCDNVSGNASVSFCRFDWRTIPLDLKPETRSKVNTSQSTAVSTDIRC
jgi:hypothetical protein